MGWDGNGRSGSEAMVVFGSSYVDGHTVVLRCCRSAQLVCLYVNSRGGYPRSS